MIFNCVVAYGLLGVYAVLFLIFSTISHTNQKVRVCELMSTVDYGLCYFDFF